MDDMIKRLLGMPEVRHARLVDMTLGWAWLKCDILNMDVYALELDMAETRHARWWAWWRCDMLNMDGYDHELGMAEMRHARWMDVSLRWTW